MVRGTKLENPTPLAAEIDVLASKAELLAAEAHRAHRGHHRRVHQFLAATYTLYLRLKGAEPEFLRLMLAKGIKRPKMEAIHLQVIQAFQPEEARRDRNSKAETSRLARALKQAAALGWPDADFIKRIERKEMIAGRRVSGVSKLIRLAQNEGRTARARKPDINLDEVCVLLAAALDRSRGPQDRLAALNAATAALEGAGVASERLRLTLHLKASAPALIRPTPDTKDCQEVPIKVWVTQAQQSAGQEAVFAE